MGGVMAIMLSVEWGRSFRMAFGTFWRMVWSTFLIMVGEQVGAEHIHSASRMNKEEVVVMNSLVSWDWLRVGCNCSDYAYFDPVNKSSGG